MVLNAWTAQQIVAAEKPHLAAGVPLMTRAARSLAETMDRTLRRRTGGVYGRRVVLLVGSGNNGGDALFAGEVLRGRGAAVTALLVGARHHEAGAAALERTGGRLVSLAGADDHQLADAADLARRADLVVDGMLGTGGRGGLRGEAAETVRRISAAESLPPVIACDVPSGLDATTGRVVDPVLPAETTVAFIGATTGLLAPARPGLVGRIEIAPLGIEGDLPAPAVRSLEDTDFALHWPVPAGTDQKYSRGVLGTVVGSDSYPGAGLMCVRAAADSGVGMVRWIGGDRLAAAMAVIAPEAVRAEEPGDGRVQAWAVGSGAVGEDQQKRIEEVLDSGLPVVADAAAVAAVARRAARSGPLPSTVLLTPHAGELAEALDVWSEHASHRRLNATVQELLEDPVWGGCVGALLDARDSTAAPDRGEIETCPLLWARFAHAALGATVLLKGPTTVVVGPQACWAHTGGSPWLATAGSGDTLSGILGAGLAGAGARAETEAASPDVAGTAAAALLVQRSISFASGGPVPGGRAAERIPAAIGRLIGN